MTNLIPMIVLAINALFVIPILLIKGTRKRFLEINEMLISAKYKSDKIIAQHVERIDGQRDFCSEMRKDRNNGWTKERTMRYAASVPESSIERYEELHPGFKTLAFGKVKDWKLRDKAIREFLKWEENRQFVWGNV